VTQLHLLSVSVGKPRIIGAVHGEPVLSGIAKHPVTDDIVQVSATNITGDAQADLAVHGGPDKAVYIYPSDHWPWWKDEHGLSCAPATFGENLTLHGADETQIHIGDRFRWGDVVIEVSQPRGPCYKLGIHARADAPALMTLSGRCGWYCRVLAPGDAPSHGTLERVHKSESPSVRDAFFAAYNPKTAQALRKAVHDAPALAEDWRFAVARRLKTAPDSNF
jgi:MOSC domain-containing protein YiiM